MVLNKSIQNKDIIAIVPVHEKAWINRDTVEIMIDGLCSSQKRVRNSSTGLGTRSMGWKGKIDTM
ncbi:hypothetical protein BV25DRAFT_1822900 [Artomyces pyxidatus]|uniref:Uncharacterized protein n=1 Tax=Artomyces pyxidatus TaxID=48021 RepID=A0ACB8T6Z4_9AGAM|nr:hypothetical protein BV25DRAFT_1822900 [Artomyces pyxidatus]